MSLVKIDTVAEWLDQACMEDGAKVDEIGARIVELFETHRPLSDESIDWTNLDDKERKQLSKDRKKWHVKLNDLVTRESKETNKLRLLTHLATLSLQQCSLEQIDECISLHIDSISKLLAKNSSDDGVALSGSYLAEIVAAKSAQPNPTAAANSEAQSVLGRLVLQYSKAFRALAEARTVANAQEKNAFFVALDALASVLETSPGLCRASVGQIEAGCVALLCKSHGPLQDRAAALLTLTPSSYGSSASMAWNGLINALLKSSLQLLRKVFKTKVSSLLPQLEESEYYATVASIGECPVSRLKLSSEDLNSVAFATVFKGLCSCLSHALTLGQVRRFHEFKLAPFVSLVDMALNASYARSKSVFALTANGALQLLETLVCVARLQLLQFRSKLHRCLERLLALPDYLCSTTFLTRLFRTCRIWVSAFGSACGEEFCTALTQRACGIVNELESSGSKQKSDRISLLSKEMSGRASKKRRMATRIVQNASSQGSSSELVSRSQSHFQLCCEALDAVSILLSVAGSLLKAQVREELDGILLRALRPISNGSAFVLQSEAPCTMNAQYMVALLDVLVASVCSPVESRASTFALPIALRIFQSCRFHPNQQVVERAIRAQASALALIHPTAPVIGAPKKLVVYHTRETHENGQAKQPDVMEQQVVERVDMQQSRPGLVERNDDQMEQEMDLQDAATEENDGNMTSKQDESREDSVDGVVDGQVKDDVEAEEEVEDNEEEEVEDNEEVEEEVEDNEEEDDDDDDDEEEEMKTKKGKEESVLGKKRKLSADHDDSDSDLPSIVDDEE